MVHEFTLKYQVGLASEGGLDALIERLGEAGCDDALVGSGQPGRLALAFSREAADAAEAMRSALRDARQAMPEATLIEAGPDLVGLTETADLMGMSRQNMRKLMLANDDFPAPVHGGGTALWHLADLLHWLAGRGYAVPAPHLAVARVTMQVNIAKEALRLSATLTRTVQGWLG
ncbi:helix-turn-helix transcriptional regulator [Pseudomonadota bacterium AL_CKDN230030165-1A_HGKHYDSX7]